MNDLTAESPRYFQAWTFQGDHAVPAGVVRLPPREARWRRVPRVVALTDASGVVDCCPAVTPSQRESLVRSAPEAWAGLAALLVRREEPALLEVPRAPAEAEADEAPASAGRATLFPFLARARARAAAPREEGPAFRLLVAPSPTPQTWAVWGLERGRVACVDLWEGALGARWQPGWLALSEPGGVRAVRADLDDARLAEVASLAVAWHELERVETPGFLGEVSEEVFEIDPEDLVEEEPPSAPCALVGCRTPAWTDAADALHARFCRIHGRALVGWATSREGRGQEVSFDAAMAYLTNTVTGPRPALDSVPGPGGLPRKGRAKKEVVVRSTGRIQRVEAPKGPRPDRARPQAAPSMAPGWSPAPCAGAGCSGQSAPCRGGRTPPLLAALCSPCRLRAAAWLRLETARRGAAPPEEDVRAFLAVPRRIGAGRPPRASLPAELARPTAEAPPRRGRGRPRTRVPLAPPKGPCEVRGCVRPVAQAYESDPVPLRSLCSACRHRAEIFLRRHRRDGRAVSDEALRCYALRLDPPRRGRPASPVASVEAEAVAVAEPVAVAVVVEAHDPVAAEPDPDPDPVAADPEPDPVAVVVEPVAVVVEPAMAEALPVEDRRPVAVEPEVVAVAVELAAAGAEGPPGWWSELLERAGGRARLERLVAQAERARGGAAVDPEARGLAEARRREALVRPLLEGGQITHRAAEVAVREGIALRTVYRWMALYEAGGLDALRARPRRAGDERVAPLGPGREARLRRCFEELPARRIVPASGPGYRAICAAFARARLDPPSRSTVRERWIAHLARLAVGAP